MRIILVGLRPPRCTLSGEKGEGAPRCIRLDDGGPFDVGGHRTPTRKVQILFCFEFLEPRAATRSSFPVFPSSSNCLSHRAASKDSNQARNSANLSGRRSVTAFSSSFTVTMCVLRFFVSVMYVRIVEYKTDARLCQGARGGILLIARSASAVIVSEGLTPGLAEIVEPSQTYMFS